MRDNSNNNMESFYEEESTPFTTAPPNTLKRPLTLDLNGKTQANKRIKLNSSVNSVSVLNSPDLQLLKMASPELEKFIMANSTIQTPTPSMVYPSKVTTEQEDYARGFVDALESLHHENSHQGGSVLSSAPPLATQPPPQAPPQQQQQQQAITNNNNKFVNSGMSGGSITYTNLDDSFPVAIKDEPQTVPNSPPLSPIDMESQEKIKLERKRQRNRVAASKCRKRKLERISKLEDKVKNLKGENTELGSVVKMLKEHVFQLKQQVIDHVQTGCNIPPMYVQCNNDSDIKQ